MHMVNFIQIFDVMIYRYQLKEMHCVVLVEQEWVMKETLVVSHVTLVMS